LHWVFGLSSPLRSDSFGSVDRKNAAATTPETSVGSDSEVNSLANGKLAESKGNIIDELDEIMEK
jgi:hypothetical protein